MNKKNRRLKKKEEEEFVALDELFLTLSKRVDKVPVGEGKSAIIKWSIVALILIAASSVLFYFKWVGTWVPAIIGAPAGVILYLIGLGLVKRTSMGEWELFQMRETFSFKQRMKKVLMWFAVYAIIFIPLGKFIPYGLGGAILILLVMTALTVARRTPQELELAKKGIPDPRDLQEEEAQDAYADDESSETEATPEADKIYYDEQRGGFGGKLK